MTEILKDLITQKRRTDLASSIWAAYNPKELGTAIYRYYHLTQGDDPYYRGFK